MMNYSGNPYFNGGMIPAQARLMQLEQQYPQYAQPAQQATQPLINATFVTNLQEAQAQPVGVNTTNVAIDNTNNKIYLKRMDNNGFSATKTYIPLEETSKPVDEGSTSEGINLFKNDLTDIKKDVSELRETFNKSLVNLSVEIENTINSSIETHIKKLKEVKGGKQ
jgi:hypothetical protein